MQNDQTNALNDLLGFLNEVETNTETDFELPDLSQAKEITNHISQLEDSVNNHKKRFKQIRKQIEIQKKKCEKEKQDLTEKYKKKIKTQGAKYQEVLQRTQELLEQVIKEKDELAQNCETLSKKAQQYRTHANDTIKHTEEQAATMIAQQRELAIAQEKARQREIFEKKAQEVKEITVQGMQPQIEKLIQKHNKVLSNLTQDFQDQVYRINESVQEKSDEEQRSIIEEFHSETQKELDAMEERMTRQIERTQQVYEAEKKRYQDKLYSLESEQKISIQKEKSDNSALLKEIEERGKAEVAAERLKPEQEIKKMHDSILLSVKKAKEEVFENYSQIEKEKKINYQKELNLQCKTQNQTKLQNIVNDIENKNNSFKKKINIQTEKEINSINKQKDAKILKINENKMAIKRQIHQWQAFLEDKKQYCSNLERTNEKISQEINIERHNSELLQQKLSDLEITIQNIRKSSFKVQEQRIDMQLESQKQIKKQINEEEAKFHSEQQKWEMEKLDIEEKHQKDINAVNQKVEIIIEAKDQLIEQLKEKIAQSTNRLQEIENTISSNQKKFSKK